MRDERFLMQDRSSLSVVLLIVVVLAGVYFIRDANLGQAAPAFSLPGPYGGRVDLASYRGRPLLLVFWTTSCSICQHELPMLSQMAPEFDSRGIAVLAIHLGGQADGENFLRSNRINLASVADPEGTVARAYHVSGVPKLVLIDSQGRVKRISSGWADKNVLRSWMDSVDHS